ncbi:hypothetical protein B0T19DRAFT_438578 [Cercophora scortea]|uniref:Uncharacterized protein n=1 Tax=Cercophora scortea TaxID=314031 RepID=A0AAE0IUS5_9PEZI|nr:hypothetical protein B0T19DRAFT_438578 [Cercophora scortea]
MKLYVALFASIAAAAPARNMLNWTHAMNLTGAADSESTAAAAAAHLSSRSTNMMQAAHTVNMTARRSETGMMHAARGLNFTHTMNTKRGLVMPRAVGGTMLNTTSAAMRGINNSTASLTEGINDPESDAAAAPSTSSTESESDAALGAQIKAKLNMLNETTVVQHLVDMVLEEAQSAVNEGRAANQTAAVERMLSMNATVLAARVGTVAREGVVWRRRT